MEDFEAHIRLISRYLEREAEAGTLTLLGSQDRDWDLLLQSSWKESLAVSLRLGEWHLQGESFFLRAPEENTAEAYHLLLQRNSRAGVWRFCANPVGDVSLIALLPRAAISEDELDRLLGTVVTITDETYVPYMKTAFATGLEEQVRRGGPGLDKPPPWAR